MTARKIKIVCITLGGCWVIFSILSIADTCVDLIKIIKNSELIEQVFRYPPKEIETFVNFVKPLFHFLYPAITLKILLALVGFFGGAKLIQSKRVGAKILKPLSIAYILLIIIYTSVLFKWNGIAIQEGMNPRINYSSYIMLAIYTFPFLFSFVWLKKYETKIMG